VIRERFVCRIVIRSYDSAADDAQQNDLSARLGRGARSARIEHPALL
jgi:hypothetical protein